eukprot:TRINITY_DN9915_c0_g1_i2.p1 TRINITY_DN9915_c0_g1~~TRINITY_DN9915_c0_g1_i2.p1  ORF type:complete len:425 (-),score=154.31 TRINITY_DN9915_c0_g1_i2:222-1496(-)
MFRHLPRLTHRRLTPARTRISNACRKIHILEAPAFLPLSTSDVPLDEVTVAESEARAGRRMHADQLLARAAAILEPVLGSDSAALMAIDERRITNLHAAGRLDDAQALAVRLLQRTDRAAAARADASSITPTEPVNGGASREAAGPSGSQQRTEAELRRASALQHVVRAYRAQGKFDEAIGFAGELVELFRQRMEVGGLAWALLEMANVRLLHAGDEKKAAELLRQALALVDDASRPALAAIKARVLNNVGVQSWSLGDPALADKFLRAALAVAPPDDQAAELDIVFNVADLQLHLLTNAANVVDQALELFQRSLRAASAGRGADSLEVAVRLHRLAVCYRRLANVVYADGLFKRCHQIFLQLPFQYAPPDSARRSSSGLQQDASAEFDAFAAAYVDFLLSQNRAGEADLVRAELDAKRQQTHS